MTHARLLKVLVIGAASGFAAMGLLAIALALIQGVFPLHWLQASPQILSCACSPLWSCL